MYKVSVIIPIYNSESSLKEVINSIMNQSIGFRNIELILVDDCSKDNSRKIIKELSNQFENVKSIFLNQNSGNASHPRNIGIENVTSDYIIFMDSDDDIFEDYCEVLWDKITQYGSDIVNCNHSEKLNGEIYIPGDIGTINHDEIVCGDVEKMLLHPSVWGNIFKTSLIRNHSIIFQKVLHEDGVFFTDCLLNTDKPVIHLPNYPGYIYTVENGSSLTHSISLESMSLFLKGYDLCYELLKKHGRHDVEKEIMGHIVNLGLFVLLKVDNIDEGMRMLYEFEKSLDFNITLNSKPLNFVNNKLMKKQFKQAKILLKLMGLAYNNDLIKNHVYVNYGNLKRLTAK